MYKRSEKKYQLIHLTGGGGDNEGWWGRTSLSEHVNIVFFTEKKIKKKTSAISAVCSYWLREE